MNAKRLVLTETVCLDEGYDNELVFRRTSDGLVEIELEGADLEIRLTMLDVNKLREWLSMFDKKGKKLPEDDDSDLEDEDEEEDSLVDEGGRLKKPPKSLPISPPVGDAVLVARLQTAHNLATNFQVVGAQTSKETKDLVDTARKYVTAQLTLPNGDE